MDAPTVDSATLSAMITPAVLISACGSLLLTTSQRLGRVITRTREISKRFDAIAKETTERPLLEEERSMLFGQLGSATRRSILLQRAMTLLYAALALFVATSLAIGVSVASNADAKHVPIGLGLFGGALLFVASLILIGETRIALGAVSEEMLFVQRLDDATAPEELLRRRRLRRRALHRFARIAARQDDHASQ